MLIKGKNACIIFDKLKNNTMKNTRGFLLAEETLKIVIAVICIGFLVYFLTALYMSNKDSKDLELAKASLKHLVDEINDGREIVEIYNPSSFDKFPGGWILISFPISGAIPNSCSNLGWENCICICNEDATTIKDTGLAEDCDNNGICLEESFIVKNKKIKLENPPVVLEIQSGEITRK